LAGTNIFNEVDNMEEKDEKLGEEFLEKYQKLFEEKGFDYDDYDGVQDTYDGKDVSVSFVREKMGDSSVKKMEIIFFINKE